MFKDGKYRYSLGFGSDTEKERRVGEFLERLGNRKSSLIIDVLNDYIEKHPEIETSQGKIKITIAALPSAPSRENLEQMVRELINETIANMQVSGEIQQVEENIDTISLNENIATMLENLDQF